VHEFAVVAHQSEEATHSSYRTWSWPVDDGLYLGRVHGHARRRDYVAQVGDGRGSEHTLCTLDEEVVAVQLVEHGAEVSKMVRPCLAVYENIVKKDKDEPAEKRAENVVHEHLERRRRVAEAERHHQELVQPIVSAERRIVDIIRTHAHLVVPRTQVQLGEVPRPMELVQQLVDHENGEGVLHRERVEGAVIDAKVPGPVGLLDKEDRRREGRVAAAYDPLLHHGRALAFQLVFVGSRVLVWPDCHRLRARLQGDAVVVSALRRQTGWFGEDGAEGVQERGEELLARHSGANGCGPGSRDAGPADQAPLEVECHASAAQVPHNRTQRAQPPCAEDDVVPSQRHDVEIGRERGSIDGEGGVTEDPGAGDVLAVGNHGDET
jgi:hypothetical protein